MVEQRGAGRWTSYTLKTSEADPEVAEEVTGEVRHQVGTKLKYCVIV
jgi:hypothetical protein